MYVYNFTTYQQDQTLNLQVSKNYIKTQNIIQKQNILVLTNNIRGLSHDKCFEAMA